jgi:glucokinase
MMQTGTLLLAGDIGGTKTKLALYEAAAGELLLVREQVYPSAAYTDFQLIVADFIQGLPSLPVTACFGVAGPVADGRCQTTNLPWLIEETAIAQYAGIASVRLLNDLQAMALGLLELPPEQWLELNPNAQVRIGNKAVIAAGTGCGEAMLCWDGERHHAMATEGGHADFAPNTPQQDGLLRWLRVKHGGHVSFERIVSGPGLFSVYQYLRETGAAAESVELQTALAAGGDPGALIGRFGLEAHDPLCVAALRLFVEVFAAEAGNLALKFFAQGGVLIGGGIAPKILPLLTDGAFMRSFCDKGRFADWAGSLSVRVALNPDAGLLGAAQYAARLAR